MDGSFTRIGKTGRVLHILFCLGEDHEYNFSHANFQMLSLDPKRVIKARDTDFSTRSLFSVSEAPSFREFQPLFK